jgi:hypothetical protein
MFGVIKYIFNLISSGFGNIFNNCIKNDNFEEIYIIKNYENNINSKSNFICHVCSYNLANTRCYEFECVNYGKQILF